MGEEVCEIGQSLKDGEDKFGGLIGGVQGEHALASVAVSSKPLGSRNNNKTMKTPKNHQVMRGVYIQ